MKSYLFIIGFILTSCSEKQETKSFSDDYVLIEFASKLEEDYHKIENASASTNPHNKSNTQQ